MTHRAPKHSPRLADGRRLMRRVVVDLGLAACLFVAGCATDGSAAKSQPGGAPATPPGETRLRVESFTVRGTDRFDADTVKDGLATAEDPGWRAAIPWMPLIGAEHHYFNRITWRRDLKRIHTFYRLRGYFNAKVISKSIVKSPKDASVRIDIRIDEGKPTSVDTLRVEGLDQLAGSTRGEVLDDLALEDGQTFTQAAYLAARKSIVDRLQQRSFAYAQISGRAVINPQTNTAKVYYFVDPGPRATFGEIHIIGNDGIERHFVLDELDIAAGQPFSGAALGQAQADLYAMGVFSLVSVLPAHEASEAIKRKAGLDEPGTDATPTNQSGSDTSNTADNSAAHEIESASPAAPTTAGQTPNPTDASGNNGGHKTEETGISQLVSTAQKRAESRAALNPRVPIVVRLKEGRLWNVELGAGLALETNRSDIHGEANWSSQNFFGGLRKLKQFNTVGYAWAANAGDATLNGPVLFGANTDAANEGVFLESGVEFQQPQFVEPKTTLKASVGLNRDIEVGYTVWNPQGTIGLERPFFDHLTVGVNYHIAYYAYSDLAAALLTSPDLGVDYQRNYLLETLEQRLTLDLRDHPLNPQSGFFSTLSVQEAGSYIAGGDFDFLKLIWDNEAYLPVDLLTQWVFALRVRAGAIYNLEAVQTGDAGEVRTRAVPIQNRLYSGGPNHLRGLGRKNLSYFRVAPFDPAQSDDVKTVEVVPVGGLSLVEASVEPRFKMVDNLAGLGSLWGLVFYDVATVLDQQLLVSTDAGTSLGKPVAGVGDIAASLIHGVGAGAFWLTPVGPVRADIALTLNDLSHDPRFRTCGPPGRVGSQVTETGQRDCTFLPVDQDPIQQQLNLDFSFFIGIGHSF